MLEWLFKKQNCAVGSTTEAPNVVVAVAANEKVAT
jgi:hypothetical protein